MGRATTNPLVYHINWLQWMLEEAARVSLATSVEGEAWAARIGDCAVVGTPGELFGEIGASVRAGSPAGTTTLAGYCGGVLGYVATPEEYPYGGDEPAVSHRGYGHPAPFSPEVASILRDASLELQRLPRTARTPILRCSARDYRNRALLLNPWVR